MENMEQQELGPTEYPQEKYSRWVAATDTPENRKRAEERRRLFVAAEKQAASQVCALVKDFRSTQCPECYMGRLALLRENLSRWTLAVRRFVTGYQSKEIHPWLVRRHCATCQGTGVIAVLTYQQEHKMRELSAEIVGHRAFGKACGWSLKTDPPQGL